MSKHKARNPRDAEGPAPPPQGAENVEEGNNTLNSLNFLQRSSEPVSKRCHLAHLMFERGQISSDALMKWLSKSFSNDSGFRGSSEAWKLFDLFLKNGNFRSDRFSIFFKRQDLLTIYKSDLRQEAFDVLEYLVTRYPNAWRPKYSDLMTFIAQMLEGDVHTREVSMMMRILMEKPEVIAAIDILHQQSTNILLKPILNNAKMIDMDLAFNLLATTLCVPSFVNKVANDTKSKAAKTFIDLLNSCNNSPLFAPYLIRMFFKQARLLNLPTSLAFPLEIIENSKSLDIAVPLIHECHILKVYRVETESQDLNRLKELAYRAIKEKHSSLLVELTHIDFRVIRPNLNLILPDSNISKPPLFLAILQQCLLLRNPTILFEGGNFPSHILSCYEFINQFCEGVKHMVSRQLINLLDHLVGFSQRLEESTLLFWAIKVGRLTEEFIDIIDALLSDCFTNPWRFAAAVIAAKKLQRRMPPPLPIVTDITTHPVILECFLQENYGTISLQYPFPNKFSIAPKIPSPYMKNAEIYRFSFIIQNLPIIAANIAQEDMINLIQYIFKKSLYANSLDNPETLADYCLILLHNTLFYESFEIKDIFSTAVLPLLPSGHFRSNQVITPKLQLRSALIAILPPEFLTEQVSAAAFMGLFVSSENNDKMSLASSANEIFADFNEGLVSCICNVAENLPLSSVKHNINRIFSNCSKDSIESLIPIFLNKIQENKENDFSNKSVIKLPTAPIENPSQLIAICNFCYENKFPLPFDDSKFPDDLISICAQIRVGHPNTISMLVKTEISPNDSPLIISALNDFGKLSELPEQFLQRLIDSFVQNEEIYHKISSTKMNDELLRKKPNEYNNVFTFNSKILSQFVSKLPIKLILYFLDTAPVEYYPHIFSNLNIKKDEFAPFENYLKKLLMASPPIPIIKLICSIRLSHNYNNDITTRLLLLITKETNKPQNLNCICLLCNCMVQLINNCGKELAKQPVYVIEIVRKLSILFAKSISLEQPTYRNLKQISKLYASVAKGAYAEYLQYLIASFVSHLTLYKPDESENLKMRSLQTAIFPLFSRCSKDQLNEISAALHDSHREVFKQLSERWTNEAQYRGKV